MDAIERLRHAVKKVLKHESEKEGRIYLPHFPVRVLLGQFPVFDLVC